MQAGNEVRKAASKVTSMHLHPDLHKALKISAAQAEVSMAEKLHSILCFEFDRLDLLSRDPETASSQ